MNIKKTIIHCYSSLNFSVYQFGLFQSKHKVIGPFMVILIFFSLLYSGCLQTNKRGSQRKNFCNQSSVTEGCMSYLDNGTVRVGVNLDAGGAITYLSDSRVGVNMVNNHDWGRQIQMSFYSGPIPYLPNGKKPAQNWLKLGWNPVQSGDAFGNQSEVLEFANNGNILYVKCRPMHWPHNNVPANCTFETQLRLNGNAVQVTSRIHNFRKDKNQYPARMQELPALYTNESWHRLFTYTGPEPFTGDALTQIKKSWSTEQDLRNNNVWARWLATENWAALVDDKGRGVGLWHDDAYIFQGGFFGVFGKKGPKDAYCGYFAPHYYELLDYNIEYEYNYVLIVGSVDEIRNYVYKNSDKENLPEYFFEKDRCHWYYRNAIDAGWPIEGLLDIKLEGPDSCLVSPNFITEADKRSILKIEAAFKTNSDKAKVCWQKFNHNNFSSDCSLVFDIVPDGKFREYKIDLSSQNEYQGKIKQLLLYPTLYPGQEQWVKIKKICLMP